MCQIRVLDPNLHRNQPNQVHDIVLVTLSIAGVDWHNASGRELAPSKSNE